MFWKMQNIDNLALLVSIRIFFINIFNGTFCEVEGPVWLNELGSWIYLTTLTSLSPIRRGLMPGFVNYKKGALDSQLQVIKFTSCLPTVGNSLRVLLLPQPLKLVAMV
jgi:hypothetical protein